jgi:hypothetical protein
VSPVRYEQAVYIQEDDILRRYRRDNLKCHPCLLWALDTFILKLQKRPAQSDPFRLLLI